MTSSISPAQRYATENAWLTKGKNSPVVAIKPAGPTMVNVIVRDSWADADEDPQTKKEMNATVADHGASLLEDVVDGVKVIVKSTDGYVGKNDVFPTGDEQFFGTSIPGVTSQFAEVEYDVNGDGKTGEDETAMLFEVNSAKRQAQIDKIVIDKYGDYPVRYEVRPY